MNRDEALSHLVESLSNWPELDQDLSRLPFCSAWHWRKHNGGAIYFLRQCHAESIGLQDWLIAKQDARSKRMDQIGRNGNDGLHYEGQSMENSGDTSDGSTASYYELPEGATELQHLISHRDMNAQMGEIFRAVYRYGIASHSDKLRDAKKVKFYIDAEIERLEKLTHNS